MLMKVEQVGQDRLKATDTVVAGVLLTASVLIALVAFGGPLLELVRRWGDQEEYSHGYLIPFIAAWLLWMRRSALAESIGRPSWMGPALILVAAAMHVVGKLSSLFVMSQLGFIIALFGIVLSFGGYSLLKMLFVPITVLLFAIPLPYFLEAVLTYRLQLISSQLGTDFIRLLNIPVYLEGNVIDMGVYQLQVVEACSGLRYLYPLMCLGFLAAYLFQAPLWQRAVIFLSTIPITIFMNSFRIGLVGVLVDNFGPQDADGFLHMFEGWVIFIACAAVLVAEITLLARLALKKKFFEVFHPPVLSAEKRTSDRPRRSVSAPLASSFVLVCAAGVATFLVATRQEIIPDREPFASFPTIVGDWRGHPSSLGQRVLQVLGLTDYIISDYTNNAGRSVNFYVAYYASQRSGISPHSPSVCIPGNGWQITDLERTTYTSANGSVSLPINRVIIKRGSEEQLVYYWFDERGMKIANEYVSKMYLLRDAILINRTDGALVRLTTPVYPGESETDAEKRLQQFTGAAVPILSAYLPSADTTKSKSALSLLDAAH